MKWSVSKRFPHLSWTRSLKVSHFLRPSVFNKLWQEFLTSSCLWSHRCELSADFGFGLWWIIEGGSPGSPPGVLQSGAVGNVQAIVLAQRGESTLRWDRRRKEKGVWGRTGKWEEEAISCMPKEERNVLVLLGPRHPPLRVMCDRWPLRLGGVA